MQEEYPKTWKYLKRFERLLRARELNSFDYNEWYRFGRHQNIDKQDIPKFSGSAIVHRPSGRERSEWRISLLIM